MAGPVDWEESGSGTRRGPDDASVVEDVLLASTGRLSVRWGPPGAGRVRPAACFEASIDEESTRDGPLVDLEDAAIAGLEDSGLTAGRDVS